MQWSIERVVTLLSPLFVALSGVIATGAAKLIPGVNIPNGDITALFVTGATLGGAAVLKWLHGRQLFIKAQSDVETFAAKVKDAIKADPPAALALADVESVLRAHTDQIVQAIGAAVHAPPSAEAIAQKIIAGMVPGAAPIPPVPGDTPVA